MTAIAHLFEHPQHRARVAELIHDEFWRAVPGASALKMQARLGEASHADRVPLCLVALDDGRPVGVVNLVDSDDEKHTEWHPWLAGLVVESAHRGQGVGSQLVRSLLGHAQRLGFAQIYFGTDGPGFYTRLGAVLQLQLRADFCFMRFDTGRRASAP